VLELLPTKLKRDTILEALFELRFEPALPNEAVFGAIYPIVTAIFNDLQHIPLPLSHLPDVVRNSDVQFKYQPLNRLQRKGSSVSIGPRVISFSVTKPYIGWSEWKPTILKVLDNIFDKDVIKYVERAGLRYLNFIEQDVFPLINVNVEIIDKNIKPTSTTIRTEIMEQEYLGILQLTNNASINENGQLKKGSLIDIDIARNREISCNTFKEDLETILDTSHTMEKQLFFNILKTDFLNELGPIYDNVSNG